VRLYPFIEAEKSRQRSVKRACELLGLQVRLLRSARGRAVGAGRAGRRARRAGQEGA
jgi:hypothetical protein